MLSTGWETVSYPSGFYESGADKTYAVWQFVGLLGYKGVHVAAYDHTTSAWGERYTVGNFLLANDDHGHPALVRDSSGYIHCYFGSHNSPFKYSVTNAADDISAWTQRPDIGTALTYPKPVLVGSTIYLFARDSTTATRLKLGVSTMTPVAGIGTHGAFTILVDFGADTRVYTTECHAIGTDIHFCCMYTPISDSSRQHVYYMVYDTTTGDISNYDGSVTVTSGSLPISLATANTSFRIVDHGADNGDVPSLQFDTSGNAHVAYANGTEPTYDLEHIMLSGGSWSSPVTIGTLTDQAVGGGFSGYVDSYCLVPGASGTMEAWFNTGGDLLRRVRSSGGTWATAETILTAGTYDVYRQAAVKNADPAFRTLFAESSGTATDSAAVNLGLFAYGDSGPMNDAIDMTAVDPAGWSNVVMLLGANHRDAATTIIDESKSCVIMTFSGNAQIDTAQTPFAGMASLLLDGTGDYLTALNNSIYSVSGTSDFSITGWVRRNDTGRLQTIMAKRAAGGTPGEFGFYINATNQLQMLMLNGASTALNLISTATMTTGAWYYVEVSRISNVTYLFLDGNLEASGTQASNPTTNSQALLIGRDVSNTARDFNGWLAELRFTRAGRNSASYTAPTTPAPRR